MVNLYNLKIRLKRTEISIKFCDPFNKTTVIIINTTVLIRCVYNLYLKITFFKIDQPTQFLEYYVKTKEIYSLANIFPRTLFCFSLFT